jgi:RimJ/RimL family protein N-acetyltransferase
MRGEIATERLLLRPFREGDVDDVLAYAADETWARFLSLEVVPAGFALEHARRFVGVNVERPGPATSFAIEREKKVIGSVHLLLEPARNLAELACLIAREQWSRGYAREVGRAMLTHGFDTLGLARIWARADARNERSLRAMEALGMRREGLLRMHRIDRQGVRCDEVVYGILREEGRP